MTAGIPVSVNGEPAFRAGSIAIHTRGATDDAPFLVGGWFHAGAPRTFCPYAYSGTRWDLCKTLSLYDRAAGGSALWIYPGDAVIDSKLPFAALRAVVLKIHTHDRACVPDLKGCASLPVLDDVVWLGPI